jgi:hypothetical protein
MAHELGHAADPDTSKPYAERRADAMANAALGKPVRYDDADVQNLHHGVTPRPARLHENREPEMKRNPRKVKKPALDALGNVITIGDLIIGVKGRWEHDRGAVKWISDDGEVCEVEMGLRRVSVRAADFAVMGKARNPKKGYKMPETQARHTAEGLLHRMLADGADTFAKKVAWVKKHMPSIDRPRTFVGWVTKGERGRVVLSRNPTPAYHRSRGDAELMLAEDSYRKAQALRRRGDASGSHDALIHAHRMAALAEADLLDGASPRAADAKRLAWWKAYSGLAADKRRNPR